MTRALMITAILAAAGACGSAAAQDALGDGRALDNSLSTESRFNARRPSLADEFRFRNAIVTGNAPNGMSFRGDIGYRAPGEFTGQLGSNDLYSFRRDALNSGLAGLGIRGSEALQMQFALTTGAEPPRDLMGSYALPRAGGNAIRPTTFNDPLQPDAPLQRAPEIYEPDSASLASLRAPSSFDVNRGYQPMLLMWETPEEGEDWYGLTASELRGVTRAELSPPGASARRINNAVAPERFETSFTAMMDRLRAESQALPELPPATEEDTRPAWQRRFDELRLNLLQPNAPTPGTAPAPEGEGAPADQGATPAPTGVPRVFDFDADTIDLLRSRGAPARDFVAPDLNGVYAEHMRIGQQHFQEGRYFDAEERFAHALSIQPNDVAAQTARVHAQIGGGMYLSAALNLGSLLFDRPTAVALRYDPSLLPSPERIVEVVAALRQGMAEAQRDEPSGAALRRARASGLLLAYIGFQTGDDAMVTEGIDGVRSAIKQSPTAGNETDNRNEQRLMDLIEAVWSNKQAP